MKPIQTRTLLATVLAVCSFAAAAADTAPAANGGSEIDGKKEVAYTCQVEINGKLTPQKVTAMYGFKGNDIVVAQLKIGRQVTPGMWRDGFVPMNRFISQDNNRTTVWTTMPATADNVTQVDGGKLSVGQGTGAQQSIILDSCKLDRAATARLNR